MRSDTSNIQYERAALRGNPSFVWRAGQERRLAMILDAAPERLERVLVDGCGVGMYVRALQEYAVEVHGLDIEGEHLIGAVENAPGAGLVLGRGEQLPYPDNSFDLILLTSSNCRWISIGGIPEDYRVGTKMITVVFRWNYRIVVIQKSDSSQTKSLVLLFASRKGRE